MKILKQDTIQDYIESLKKFETLSPFIVAHRKIPDKKAEFSETKTKLSGTILKALKKIGIDSLFSHQAEAIDSILKGRNTVIATPTASGKTLIYNIPVIEKIIKNEKSRSLYLFPLKALAQDQLKSLQSLFSAIESPIQFSAEIYDGDTSQYKRGKIRKNPPNVVLSNPEMLHLSILPYHDKWSEFLSNLDYVVIDEVHTLRGVMGSHMAWVFRRLLRICSYYGANPVFIFCSATINNPKELAENLTGLEIYAKKGSGAAQNGKNFIMLNTPEDTSRSAITLLHAAMHRNLRTIVYTQSRKMTELIADWASSKSESFSTKINAYRSGYLPEERREIESKLVSGELLAVVSTSALEMGIDIGGLDLCILVGYPGTIMSTWQRAGRVGRKSRDSLVIFIAHEDALDQYMMNHPDEFFNMPPESAVINPFNNIIMEQHLECAVSELSMDTEEPFINLNHNIKKAVKRLENKCKILKTHDGSLYIGTRKYPQRKISLRGGGSTFDIVNEESGGKMGTIDHFKAFHETYPGAVYLHNGEQYIITKLDIENKNIYAAKQRLHYYTRARTSKETEIIKIHQCKAIFSAKIFKGTLRVTEIVTGFEKRLKKGSKFSGVIPLDLPPLVFETHGLWIEIPEQVRAITEKSQRHFMGGIHAVEHAMIGLLPVIVMADRNDFGGISIPYHPQVGSGAIFVYDSAPGGVGLTSSAFDKSGELLEKTLEMIKNCPCETGCPACVHSPKCGSGNRPIDKHAAIFVLESIKNGKKLSISQIPVINQHKKELPEKEQKTIRFGVLDLETRRSADDVGGWQNASKMGVSCVVVYDSSDGLYHEYKGEDINKLVEHLKKLDLVIGFNIIRFDYLVLKGLSGFDFYSLPTLDILQDIYKRLSYRLSLDRVGEATLGTKKSADGLLALKWWKEGKIRKIIDYCIKDVEITKDLYLYGLKNKYLLFRNKAGMLVRLPVDW